MAVKPLPPIFIANLLCGLGLALALWVANIVNSINLVTNPSRTLFFIWVIELPIVILLYSCCRMKPHDCGYLRAVGRGILAVPAGALLISLLAISLRAPVTSHYLPMIVHWSIMTSLLTIVPTSCVLGSSWDDWLRILLHLQSDKLIEDLLCVQVSCAGLGPFWGSCWPTVCGWLGWERPEQEWPIFATYGALGGYLVGLVMSSAFVLLDRRRVQHVHQE